MTLELLFGEIIPNKPGVICFKKKGAKKMSKSKDVFTEYTITYNDNRNDFISENKSDADVEFEKTKADVRQYFSKDWVFVGGSWQEDDVVVFYGIGA